MDEGQKYTDQKVKEIEKRLNREYAQAELEMEERLDDYFRRYEKKDERWQEWVAEGRKTEKEYQEWRTGQMAVGATWQNEIDALSEKMAHTNETARAIARNEMPDVFAENMNFATYQIEHDAEIDTSFTLYSRETVERLIADDPDILPPIGRQTARRIREGKDVLWNKQQIQSVMVQGILQGDSIPNLATRLSLTVGEKNRKAAIRNARTLATGCQNAGRVNAYKRAQNKGVDLEQMWLATMDNRTRHTHRWIDREVRPVGEAFSNGCEYPADPKGDPAEIYNCRCSLRGVVKGLDRRSGQFRDSSAVGNMSYSEWRKAKPESQDILLQEQKGDAIRRSYIREYMGGRGGNYAKSIPELFSDDGKTEKYTITDVIDNLNSSQIGRESLQYIEDFQYKVKMMENTRTGNRGEQFTDRLEIYTNNINTTRVAAQTVVHEVSHKRYNIGGSQLDEAICMATEKMHKENRMYLTDKEWEQMKTLARDNYGYLPFKREDENYEKFSFINRKIGEE